MNWPNRVWEMGSVTEDGRQLYWSREPTLDDHRRRREYEAEYNKRLLEKQS